MVTDNILALLRDEPETWFPVVVVVPGYYGRPDIWVFSERDGAAPCARLTAIRKRVWSYAR